MKEIGTLDQAFSNVRAMCREIGWHRTLYLRAARDRSAGRPTRSHLFLLVDEETKMSVRIMMPWCDMAELRAPKGPDVVVGGVKLPWTKATNQAREMLRPTHTIP